MASSSNGPPIDPPVDRRKNTVMSNPQMPGRWMQRMLRLTCRRLSRPAHLPRTLCGSQARHRRSTSERPAQFRGPGRAHQSTCPVSLPRPAATSCARRLSRAAVRLLCTHTARRVVDDRRCGIAALLGDAARLCGRAAALRAHCGYGAVRRSGSEIGVLPMGGSTS